MERVNYLCAGIITSNVLNLFRTDEAEIISPYDFVPGGAPEEIAETGDEWIEANIARAQLWALQWNSALKLKEQHG